MKRQQTGKICIKFVTHKLLICVITLTYSLLKSVRTWALVDIKYNISYLLNIFLCQHRFTKSDYIDCFIYRMFYNRFFLTCPDYVTN